ncbi:MAG: tetratricopeptide repeat protein [Planctomycetes bacterium]|nr:tetratricopeptide repeat protein [Planctomycetota bacterium]
MLEFMNKYSVFLVCFALAASTLLVFWQVRTFDFVDFDDHDYVYNNQHVSGGLTWDGIIWAFTSGHAFNWHPMTWLSLMLDCELFGVNPGRMHIVNVVLHLANTLLLFAVLSKMTGSLWPSAFVAAAFALHPMHVESVAWITERKDVLSTFFLLLTLAAYAGYVKRPSVFKYIISLIFFALGLMAKPMLVTLPLVLLLLDYWPLNRFDSLPVSASGRQPRKLASPPTGRVIWYRMLIEKIPFFALAALSSGITFIVQLAGGAIKDVTTLSLASRAANVFLSYLRYLGKLFWPQNLAVFYPFDAHHFSFRQIALCAILLLSISVFVIRFGRTQRYLPVGWFWFVITLIPVIGLVQVGGQAFADRYTYIPYIGLFIMIAWGLPELCSKWPYRNATLGVTAALVLTALGIGTYRQAGHWNNSITLFSHAIKVTKNNYRIHNNLGIVYSKLCRWQEAIEVYEQAIRIKPDYAEAHYNLGNAYSNLGRRQEAIEAYRQTIRIKPDEAEAYNNLGNAYATFGRYQEAIEAYRQAIRIKPECADTHYNLGIIYGNLSRWQEAIEACTQAIRIKPDFAEAYNNLGNAYVNLSRRQEAVEAFNQAIRLKPDDAKAYDNLGNILLSEGNFGEAIRQIKRSLEIEPNNIGTKNNLAWMLAVCSDPAVRDPSEAIRLAQEACTATNSMNFSVLDTLGAAYASAGRFAEAIETARTALALVDTKDRSKIKDDIQHRLTFYTQGKPYIESAQKRPGDPNKP